jgi:hypothetical protein
VKRKRGSLYVTGLLVAILLIGCGNRERLFNALDVDVFATQAGNPTELLITDMGKEVFACGEEQDSKIIRVDLNGEILWDFDMDTDILDGAHNADLSGDGQTMIISDTCRNRVLVISYPGGEILWDSSVQCPGLNLNGPNDANFLGAGLNDNLLITVRDSHWVIEVDPQSCVIVWSFGVEDNPRLMLDYDDPDRLRFPHNADRLPNGNTIIADSGTNVTGPSRIVEVDPAKNIVWSYKHGIDCTIKGVPEDCPGLLWARDADVECEDLPDCRRGNVVVSGIHQTVSVKRDLDEPPVQGESEPRGREVEFQVQHGSGYCYDTDKIAQWGGDSNGGNGFFLVSNHGPLTIGNWIRVVPVDASHSNDESVWQLRGLE